MLSHEKVIVMKNTYIRIFGGTALFVFGLAFSLEWNFVSEPTRLLGMFLMALGLATALWQAVRASRSTSTK